MTADTSAYLTHLMTLLLNKQIKVIPIFHIYEQKCCVYQTLFTDQLTVLYNYLIIIINIFIITNYKLMLFPLFILGNKIMYYQLLLTDKLRVLYNYFNIHTIFICY